MNYALSIGLFCQLTIVLCQSPKIVLHNIKFGKQFWKGEKNLPKDSIAALESCDENGLPIIYALLKIFASQPVSTASSERTFSTLRRLDTS